MFNLLFKVTRTHIISTLVVFSAFFTPVTITLAGMPTASGSASPREPVAPPNLDGFSLKAILSKGITRNTDEPAIDYRRSEVLVKYRPNITFGQAKALLLRANGAKRVERFKSTVALDGFTITDTGKTTGSIFDRYKVSFDAPVLRWVKIKLDTGVDERSILKQLRQLPEVETVELNQIISVQLEPNDTAYLNNQLWGLNNTVGNPNADISAVAAWDQTIGDPSVIIAVIDTGVDYMHEDITTLDQTTGAIISTNMWVNSSEIPGNGIDDDFNGYVDDIHGYNFKDGTGNPMDDNGHGTHVAGTIAAKGNNGLGVTGVNWTARIMALKFLGSDGKGDTEAAVNAILYATANGARIMNNSWGGGGYSQALRDAIESANQAGVLFVAAAGNGGFDSVGDDNDSAPFYPASYDVANIISVAATDENDDLTAFSNIGATSVDLAAPGNNIFSSVPGNLYPLAPYTTFSGTSMATAYISGAAGLLMAQDLNRTAPALRALLMSTADPLAASTGKSVTDGRLNINRALTCSNSSNSNLDLVTLSPGEGFIANIDSVFNDQPPITISAIVHACGKPPAKKPNVKARFDNSKLRLTLYDDGVHNDGAANDGIYANFWNPEKEGPVRIKIRAKIKIGGKKYKDIEYRFGQVVEDDDDGDGLTNVFEAEIGSDALIVDSDSDTLPDGIEVAFDGDMSTFIPYPGGGDLNPLPGFLDTDGDSYADGVEYDYSGNGADPTVLPWKNQNLAMTSTRFGASVNAIPDINNDNVSDFVVGIPPGAAGATNMPGGTVNVYSGVDNTLLYSISGDADVVDFGQFVAPIGDIDGDGKFDIVVGTGYSASAIPPGYSFSVYTGEDGTFIKQVDVPLSSDPGLITFATANESLNPPGSGMLVTDTVPDLIVGFDWLNRVDTISGVDGGLISTINTLGAGIFSLAASGDMDGDGITEIIIGSPGTTTTAILNGAVYVHSGATGTLLHQFEGSEGGDFVGISVDAAGDINGDGKPDVIVGSLGSFIGTVPRPGKVFLLSGLDGQVIRQLEGANIGDWFGISVSQYDLGDDAIPDVLVAARLGDRFDTDPTLNNGELYVFRGVDGSLAHRFHVAGQALGVGAPLIGVTSAGQINGNSEGILYKFDGGEVQSLSRQ